MDIILRRSLLKLREKLLEALQAVLLAVVTAESWQKIQKDLRRKMQIDVPGTGMEGAAAFLGVELVNEKELVLIVSRTSQKNTIMKAIMEGGKPQGGCYRVLAAGDRYRRSAADGRGRSSAGSRPVTPLKIDPDIRIYRRRLDKCGYFRYHSRRNFNYKQRKMKMTQLTRKQQQLFNALSIVVGNAMYALTVVLFLMPSGLITGGATGIALAFNKVTGLSVSAILFVVNVVMLLLGWWVLGRRFALNTLASTVLSPFFMALWERLLGNLVLTDDLVLNTVFAGFGIGISLGITIRAGASTGGMDIPPLVLNKWFHLPVSSTMMVFDFIILAAQAAFSPVRQSLYGVVMAIIYTVVLDKVLMLGTTRTEVKIISAKSDEICAAIFAQLDRGVTILHGEGGYLREPESVLLSVVSNRQLPRLEKLAHAIDPTCFMIVSHVTEVSGRGFSLEKDYQAEE